MTDLEKIPIDILLKVLNFVDKKNLKLLDFYFLKENFFFNKILWNLYSGTFNLPILNCKEILKDRIYFNKNIKNGIFSFINFRTFQSDMTKLKFINNFIFISSDDRSLNIFNLKGNLIKSLKDHTGGIWAFDTDGKYIVTGSTDKKIKFYQNMENTHCVSKIVHNSTIRCILLVEEKIICGYRDSNISIFDKKGKLLFILKKHTQSVRTIDSSNKFLISGSYDCTVNLWSLKKGKFIRQIHSDSNRIYIVKLYKNYIGIGGVSGVLTITDIGNSFKIQHNYNNGMILWLDFYENFVFSSGIGGNIVKYDFINRKMKYRIKVRSAVKAQKIYKGNLIVGTLDGCYVYKEENGELIKILIENVQISKLDIKENCIVVGYNLQEEYFVSIFKY